MHTHSLVGIHLHLPFAVLVHTRLRSYGRSNWAVACWLYVEGYIHHSELTFLGERRSLYRSGIQQLASDRCRRPSSKALWVMMLASKLTNMFNVIGFL
jgi:hypothetical protein